MCAEQLASSCVKFPFLRAQLRLAQHKKWNLEIGAGGKKMLFSKRGVWGQEVGRYLKVYRRHLLAHEVEQAGVGKRIFCALFFPPHSRIP